jgi:hypothetical protein
VSASLDASDKRVSRVVGPPDNAEVAGSIPASPTHHLAELAVPRTS